MNMKIKTKFRGDKNENIVRIRKQKEKMEMLIGLMDIIGVI